MSRSCDTCSRSAEYWRANSGGVTSWCRDHPPLEHAHAQARAAAKGTIRSLNTLAQIENELARLRRERGA